MYIDIVKSTAMASSRVNQWQHGIDAAYLLVCVKLYHAHTPEINKVPKVRLRVCHTAIRSARDFPMASDVWPALFLNPRELIETFLN